jgi:hypothetical protein
MARFDTTEHGEAFRTMRQQNITTLRALRNGAQQGGQNIFLYLERDRNSEAMGIPEPAAVGTLEMLERVGKETYIMPMHVSKIETILANKPGTNEIDAFFDNLTVGHGNVVCGRPIPFAQITDAVETFDSTRLATSVFGEDNPLLRDPKQLRYAAISATILGLVARNAPTEDAKGVYGSPIITKIVQELTA